MIYNPRDTESLAVEMAFVASNVRRELERLGVGGDAISSARLRKHLDHLSAGAGIRATHASDFDAVEDILARAIAAETQQTREITIYDHGNSDRLVRNTRRPRLSRRGVELGELLIKLRAWRRLSHILRDRLDARKAIANILQ